jgi:hypothetical protein
MNSKICVPEEDIISEAESKAHVRAVRAADSDGGVENFHSHARQHRVQLITNQKQEADTKK